MCSDPCAKHKDALKNPVFRASRVICSTTSALCASLSWGVLRRGPIMQERQFAGEAEQRTSSWYLSRGDQQWGPLGDRELLLLAERGGLRKDDLLWKPGFELWKPVRSVCDLGATSIPTPAQQAATQDADY